MVSKKAAIASRESKPSVNPIALEAPEILETANPCPGSNINVALLREIEQAILAEPARFFMRGWLKSVSCGTAACICGHAVLLNDYKWKSENTFSTIAWKDQDKNPRAIESVGMELLGLTFDQSARLFSTRYWPCQFKNITEQGGPLVEGTLEYAKNAVARIEHFIKTCGEE